MIQVYRSEIVSCNISMSARADTTTTLVLCGLRQVEIGEEVIFTVGTVSPKSWPKRILIRIGALFIYAGAWLQQ